MRRRNTWRMLLVLSAAILILGALFAWSRVLFPVMVAFLIAYLTHPLASFFERHRLPRILGFLVILLLFVSLILLIFVAFLPAIVHELMFLGQKLPSWQEFMEKHIGPLLADLEERYPESYALLQERLTEWAQQNLPSIAQRLVSWLAGLISSAFGLVGILVNLILIPVIAAYLTVDFHRLLGTLRLLVPRPVLPSVEKVMQDVNQVLRDFLKGQLLVAMALGMMYTAGLLLVRAPLALVVGPLAGFFSLVPYLGFVFGMGMASILTLLEYQDFWHPVGVLISFALAQSVDGWFLTPRLLGKRVGLHPVWILVALLLGGQLFGLPGILVGVPVAAALRVVLRHAMQAYRESLLYLGAGTEIVFYTRDGCSLCEEFERTLKPLLERRAIDFRRLNVDSSPVLKERFGSRVPVLEINGEVAAEGRIIPAELEQRLEGVLPKST
ncbi:MAG: AI-2E family transporter [Deltaproteobacteria bacterium]|nr:AI-2E family transporter [Deltaproteobacteria bacterium]